MAQQGMFELESWLESQSLEKKVTFVRLIKNGPPRLPGLGCSGCSGGGYRFHKDNPGESG